MAAAILQLSQLIATSATQLVDVCAAQNLNIPELNDTFTSESESFRKDPAAAKAVNNIVAAALQLIACVLPPLESTIEVASGHYKSAALRVAVECHVPEILREAGEQGLHADEIAAKAGVDSSRLARLLRILANRHIFREVKQDVFTNNRLSSVLDTGKPHKQILSDPKAKHVDTPGTAAFIELLAEGGHKGSAYLLETMKDPITAHSVEPQHAPYPWGLGLGKSTYEWYSEPEQAYRLHILSAAMASWSPDSLVKLFDWDRLPNDALVVDVGGGMGTLSRLIYKAHPKLKIVVQDTPSVIEDGLKRWSKEEPEAIQSGRVRFQAHDFFTPQPIPNASVFLLKHILHNWPEPYIVKILTQLRNAAAPNTILNILGVVLMPSTPTELDIKIDTISGGQNLGPPAILSTGYTSSHDTVWMLDAQMMIFTNAQQHTIHQLDRLLKSTGWKMTRVVLSGEATDSVEAVPA